MLKALMVSALLVGALVSSGCAGCAGSSIPAERVVQVWTHGWPGNDLPSSLVAMPSGFAITGMRKTVEGSVVNPDAAWARVDARGALTFAQNVAAPGYQAGSSVVALPSGELLVAGVFEGTVDFGAGPLTAQGSGSDIFLVRLGTDGTLQWARRLGGQGDESVPRLALGPAGELWLTAWLTDDPTQSACPLQAGAVPTQALMRLSEVGEVTACRFLERGAGAMLDVEAMVPDGTGVRLLGDFIGQWSLDGATLTSPTGFDLFVITFDAQLHVVSAVRPAGGDHRNAIGAAALAGGASLLGWDGPDGLGVGAFASDGALLWSQPLSRLSESFGPSLCLAVDADGMVAVAGTFDAPKLEVAGARLSPATNFTTGSPKPTAFLALYGADGQPRWAGTVVSDLTTAQAVAFDGAGHVLLAGDFDNALTVGGVQRPGQGGSDWYVVTLAR